MQLLYNLSITLLRLYFFAGRLINNKLRAGYEGRLLWQEKLKSFRESFTGEVLWIHCASLGEFEMARPLIDLLNEQPLFNSKIVLTFFSPSGYEVRKNYPKVSAVMYIPLDTPSGSSEFVSLLRPAVAIFVKYEFWYNIIRQLDSRGIKKILINGVFRKEQVFFQWYGSYFRKHLRMFDHLFVQNRYSAGLLEQIGIQQVTTSGDMRYDRVRSIAAGRKTISGLEEFKNGKFILAGGSTWAPEERLFRYLMEHMGKQLRLIIAPHDVSEKHLTSVEQRFDGLNIRRYSCWTPGSACDVLLVDSIGLLSSLYAYADAALIGGGFSGSLHNILEPAVYGIPVFFGPNHGKFPEASYFIREGIGFEVSGEDQFIEAVHRLISDKQKSLDIQASSAKIFRANAGGTDQVFYKLKGYLSVFNT